MGQILSTGWQQEHSDALVGFVADGLSYAQSAAAINEKFGTSYSRNAAIGKANRLGLQMPEGRKLAALAIRIARPKKPRIRIVAANGNSNRKRIIDTFDAEETALRCVEIIPRGLSLLELEPGDCRYPYGDSIITFCGHPKLKESSYCAPHHHLTRGHSYTLSDAERQRRRQHFIKLGRMPSQEVA